MWKRTLAGALLLAMTATAPAIGQILDTRPDVIAFYADPVGNRAGVCTLFTPQLLYLMVTHPSDASGLTGYGCTFNLPPGLVSGGFSAGSGIIVESIFPDLDVRLPAPQLPAGDAYLLGTWTVMVTSPTLDIVSLADHFPGLPAEAAYTTAGSGTTLIPVTPPDWGNGMPMGDPWRHAVLWLNEPLWCGYVTAPEATAWGAVKALFR